MKLKDLIKLYDEQEMIKVFTTDGTIFNGRIKKCGTKLHDLQVKAIYTTPYRTSGGVMDSRTMIEVEE